MPSNIEEMIKRHSAGATITHQSPFDELITFSNTYELPIEELRPWVKAYHMRSHFLNIENDLLSDAQAVPYEIIRYLLGDFNWRTRSVGSLYAGLKNLSEFEEQIQNLLLKSEVCYAGRSYARTLALFKTEGSINVLEEYLDYYLRKKELMFDQAAVMCALKYIDEHQHTVRHKKFIGLWEEYRRERNLYSDEEIYLSFKKGMTSLESLKSKIAEQ